MITSPVALPVVIVDIIMHTATRPFCSADPSCPCHHDADLLTELDAQVRSELITFTQAIQIRVGRYPADWEMKAAAWRVLQTTGTSATPAPLATTSDPPSPQIPAIAPVATKQPVSVAIYVRRTKELDHSESDALLKGQILRCRRYCREQGYQYEGCIYLDRNPALDKESYPRFDALFTDAMEGRKKFEKLLVVSLTQLSERPTGAAFAVEALHAWGIEVEALVDPQQDRFLQLSFAKQVEEHRRCIDFVDAEDAREWARYYSPGLGMHLQQLGSEFGQAPESSELEA
jgi:hypothetical protein